MFFWEAFGDTCLACEAVWLQQEQKPLGEMEGFEPPAIPQEASPEGRRWQRCAQAPGAAPLPLSRLCPRLPGDVLRAGNSSQRMRDAWAGLTPPCKLEVRSRSHTAPPQNSRAPQVSLPWDRAALLLRQGK